MDSPLPRNYATAPGNGQIAVDDSLVMTRFPDGYLSGDGKARYYFNDYQGNNLATVDANGKIVESTGYYPYGLPWEEPTENPYLYGDKEYDNVHGLGEYYYGARQSVPVLAGGFTTIDPLCEKRPDESPYILCGGNPIRNVDKDGKDVVVLIVDSEDLVGHMAMLVQAPDKSWRYYSVNGDNLFSSGSHVGGKEEDDLNVGNWESPQDFLDSDYNEEIDTSSEDSETNGYGYKEGLQISTTPEQDIIIRQAFTDISLNTEYNLWQNNCAHAVQKSLRHANVNMPAANNLRPAAAYKSIIKANQGGKIIRKNR